MKTKAERRRLGAAAQRIVESGGPGESTLSARRCKQGKGREELDTMGNSVEKG